MIDLVGYWVAVTVLVVPLPILLSLIIVAVFAECYKNELREKGVEYYEAAARSKRLPVYRFINKHIQDWMVFVFMTGSILQAGCYALACKEYNNATVTADIIQGISYIADKMATCSGYIVVVVLVMGSVPAAAKLCARFSLIKEKVDNLA